MIHIRINHIGLRFLLGLPPAYETIRPFAHDRLDLDCKARVPRSRKNLFLCVHLIAKLRVGEGCEGSVRIVSADEDAPKFEHASNLRETLR